jgi:hypothetical protein
LTIDGSSEARFTESVNAFQDKMPLARRYAFALALQDVWLKGVQDAEAEQREYTADDFFRQVDGLGYKQVVTLADPTGAAELARLKQAQKSVAVVGTRGSRVPSRWPAPNDPWPQHSTQIGPHGEQVRGNIDSGPVYQHQLRTMGQQ